MLFRVLMLCMLAAPAMAQSLADKKARLDQTCREGNARACHIGQSCSKGEKRYCDVIAKGQFGPDGRLKLSLPKEIQAELDRVQPRQPSK